MSLDPVGQEALPLWGLGSRPDSAPLPPWDQPPPQFDIGPHARRSDPVTSHAAAESMRHAAQVQKAELRDWLERQGPTGAIANEADRAHNWDDGTSGRRFRELVDEGVAVYLDGSREALGITRKRVTSRGRSAFVLVAVSHLDGVRISE